MSIFKKIGKVLKKAAPLAIGYATGGVGGVLAAAASQRGRRPSPVQPMTMLPAAGPILAGATRVLPGIGAAASSFFSAPVKRTMLRAGREVATAAGGALLYDAITGQPVRRRKYRRINPCNGKAAKRAVRRIKSTMHLLREIERLLPRQRASRSAPPPFARKRAKC